MGHIVNAKGMRLGLISSWCDEWYSELLFYPEYLHSIYRIRFFLIYFFNFHPLEQRGFFFSHFDIIKIYKKLKINIFYYDGQGESLYADMLHEFRITVLEDPNNQDPERRKPQKIFEPYKVIIIFKLLFRLSFDKGGSKMQKWLENKMLQFHFRGTERFIKYMILNHILSSDSECENLISLYFFFSLYFFNKALYKKNKLYAGWYMENVLKRFFFAIAAYDWMYMFFIYVSEVLGIIFKILNNYFKIIINFYAISNNCINARFLSRFIARKFAQNYGFYELINPIKRELTIVCRHTRGSYRGFFYGKMRNRLDYGKSTIYRKSIFKSFLTFLFIIYNKYSFKFFYKYFTLFSLNMLSIYIWFQKILTKKVNLIYFSIKFIIRRSAFSYFFINYQKNYTKVFNKFFYPYKNSVIKFLPKVDFTGFFNFIYEDFIVNSNILFITKNLLLKNMKHFRYAQYFFNRYMQYNFWIYNDGFYALGFDYNMVKKRSIKHIRGGLLGFKMQCSGRFTRRQRAKSIWFSYGPVPLNTINEKIDYSFFSIPIINSKITIKVWLYISKSYINWYYRLI